MDKMDCYALVMLYPCQFGKSGLKGASYLSRILQRYAEDGFPAEAVDYRRLISAVAEDQGIRPDSMKKSIRRFVADGWKQGFRDAWAVHTGWSRHTPPDAAAAVKLIFESYPAFIEKMQSRIQKTKNMDKLVHKSSVEEIMAADRFVALDAAKMDAYIYYLTYRVQHDLYELCKENDGFSDISWDEFVLMMRRYKSVREISVGVMCKTVSNFSVRASFDFQAKSAEFFHDSDETGQEGDWLHFAQLVPPDIGFALVSILFFRAEFLQYRRQLRSGRDFSWETYLEELRQDPVMWNEVITAFRDAVARLDFKSVWQLEGLNKLSELLEQYETEWLF